MCIAIVSWANAGDTIVVDDVYYFVYNETAADKSVEVIPHPRGYKGKVVIHSEVTQGDITYSVRRIANRAFHSAPITSISLPEGLLEIGHSAFQNCTSLTSALILPSTLQTIQQMAFQNCANITGKLTLPASLSSMGSNVFEGCASIEEIHIMALPSTAIRCFSACTGCKKLTFDERLKTTVPDYAFSGCTALESVVVPDSVPLLGTGVFQECTSLQTAVLGNGLTYISQRTFYQCTSLHSVTFPDSLTSIGNIAFEGCKSLADPLILPSTVIKLGDNSFKECTALERVVLPNTLKEINSAAFRYCSNLTHINLPDSLTRIGSYAFGGTSITGAIVIPDGVTTLDTDVFDGCKNITSVDFGDGVTTIGTASFRNCTSLTAVTFGKNLTTIKNNAFEGCTQLAGELIFPDKLTYLGPTAFCYCRSLSSIRFEAGLKRIEANTFYECTGLQGELHIPDGITYIGKSAFYRCSSLTSLTLGAQVDTIDEHAFNMCTSMTGHLHLPDGLTTIGIYAFQKCSFTTIHLSESVTSIGHSAFLHTTSLTQPVYNSHTFACMPINYRPNEANQLYDYTIPDGITTIAPTAFYSCRTLQSVTIPNTVTAIHSWAFQFCSNLVSAPIPASVTHVGESIFYGCSKLNSPVVIGDVLVHMPNAYIHNNHPDSVYTLPDSIHEIRAHAFQSCTALKQLIVHDNLTQIGTEVFTGCNNLKYPIYNSSLFLFMPRSYAGDYAIPEGIREVYAHAFANCTGLTAITIPESMDTISATAFAGCNNIAHVQWNAIQGKDYYPLSAGPFYSIRSTLKAMSFGDKVEHIPSFLCEQQLAITSLVIPDNVKSIGYSACWGCPQLQTVKIGTGVTTVGNNQFSRCTNLQSVEWNAINVKEANGAFRETNLTSFVFGEQVKYIPAGILVGVTHLPPITIPTSVDTIGDRFCNSCGIKTLVWNAKHCVLAGNYHFDSNQITSITFGDSVTHIPPYLCENWQELTSVIIPDNVTHIGKYAFNNCRNVTSIKLPNKLKKIETYAFSQCLSLGSIDIPNSVDTIMYRAFYNCPGLSSITIPKDIRYIDPSAFTSCAGMRNVYWNAKNYTPINPLSAIKGVVTTIVFGDSVQHIPANLCSSMKRLNSISISSNIQSIGANAFNDCPNLTKTNFNGTIDEWCKIAFENATSNPLYYSKNLYIHNELIDDLVIPSTVTSISQHAFRNCTSLKRIRLLHTDSLPHVGSESFAGIYNTATLAVRCPLLETVKTTAPWKSFKNRTSFRYYIDATANQDAYGYVTATDADCNSIDDIGIVEATPKSDEYRFVGWSDGVDANPRSLQMTQDTTLQAIFASQEEYTIVVDKDSLLSSLRWGQHNRNLRACDIIVRNGATLTCDEESQLVNITLEDGGTLYVEDDATLHIQRLTAQSEDDVQPQIISEVENNIQYNRFQLTKQIPADRYYFFALPFDCKTEDVTLDGAPAVYNTDWNYLYYDGADCAFHPEGSHWRVDQSGLLRANKGYAVGVDAPTPSTARTLTFSTTAMPDFTINEEKTIAVDANRGSADVEEVYKGWNFIMNPYTSNFNATMGSLSIPEATIPYVTMPDPGQNQTYTQCLFSEVENLPPFFGFFVQTAASGDVTFTPTTAAKRSAPEQKVGKDILMVGVKLSNGSKEDATTLVLGERFTEAYEIGSDLQKMLGYGDKPQVYIFDQQVRYAFRSLHPQAAQKAQPLGVYLPNSEPTTYTFSLSRPMAHNQLQAVYLHDSETDITVNLLQTHYTFVSTALATDKRFTISVYLASDNTPTATEDIPSPFFVTQRARTIMLQGLQAGDQLRILNIQGQVLLQWVATQEAYTIPLPQAGLYIVERTNHHHKQIKKVILP